MQVQYNFKIEEELKEQVEEALRGSGAENKSAFLGELLSNYNTNKTNNADIEIDLSKYDNLTKQNKEAVSNAFKHILGTLDNNLSSTKQNAIYIEEEKKALVEKEEGFNIELLKVKAAAGEKVEKGKL